MQISYWVIEWSGEKQYSIIWLLEAGFEGRGEYHVQFMPFHSLGLLEHNYGLNWSIPVYITLIMSDSRIWQPYGVNVEVL